MSKLRADSQADSMRLGKLVEDAKAGLAAFERQVAEKFEASKKEAAEQQVLILQEVEGGHEQVVNQLKASHQTNLQGAERKFSDELAKLRKTNAQGQRICRQCGLVGRYKDGECVEKWGPGPEGPGTVSNKSLFVQRIISFSVLFVQPVANGFFVFNRRCRKMKRVERRGTIESQQQRERYQQVQQALAIHRSQQQNSNVTNPLLPPPTDDGFHERAPSSNVGPSLRRTGTVVVGSGMKYEHSSRATPPPSRPEDGRTHLMHPGNSEIALHDGANGNGTPSPPREPVTVPARSDLDHRVQDASPPRASVKGKSPASSPSRVHQQAST